MDQDRNSRLAEWYGAGEGSAPTRYNGTACAETTETPPIRVAGPSPRRRAISRAAALCVLLVAVIAASALLFSGGGSPVYLPAPEGPEAYSDYRDYFAHYYDSAKASGGSCSIERAETGTGVTLEASPLPEGAQLTLTELYERCSDSIAAITCSAGDGRYYWGSGVIMNGEGYILTNAHLVEGAETCSVELADGREYDALLVGMDSPSDIAVIMIDAPGLSPAEFSAGEVRVGEAAAAIGNPLGPELRGTMTQGIISGISRDITYTGFPMTLIQTDAAINEGSSGGALFNMYGQVIGMTSMKLVSSSMASRIEGVGFAIPMETIEAVANALIADGRVLGRPALGVTVGDIPADAAAYYDIPDALYVISVTPDSDAEAKGVRAGVILVYAEGSYMSSSADLSAVIAGKAPGDEVSIELYRPEGKVNLSVALMDYAEIY